MEAVNRGAKENPDIHIEEYEDIVDTDFGPVYMGYRVTATATGELNLNELA
ncbi:MAG: hypothetical protein Q4E53_06450 [Eubacteriales bacterium]|nr:hypothetical protein [Eubacteriales bacterium]